MGEYIGFIGFRVKGSKDPNKRVVELKYCTMNGVWALKPYYLSPWTLRVARLCCRAEKSVVI